MPRRLLAASLSFVFASSFAAAQSPPPDSAIEQVLAQWKQTRKRSLDGKPDPAAAASLGELSIPSLSLPQLERLCAAMLPQTADAVVKDACRARLVQLAAEKTADGAVAAARLCEFVDRADRDAPAAAQQQAVRQRCAAIAAAAKHPGLPAAVAAGRATSLYLQVWFQREPKALAEAGVIQALLAGVTRDWPAARVRELLAFQETAAEPEAGLDAAAREALRTTSLAVLERALADPQLEARERKYLDGRRDHLLGAAARGELLDHPAPAIEFLWSNHTPAPKSFADFRGKIVVVDFWATWCVPCVAAFPHVREMTQRYRDLPVVFVGITSLQGFVSRPKASDPKQRRTETKDPEAELAMLGPWCQEMDVTWTAVVSRQDCFNPDFGVRSIPQLAILDADGVVRWSGLPAEGTAVEDHVDELLRKMGKVPPARPKETGKGPGEGGH